MASKQLGKLRQLMGEVIMSRDKTIQSDEFRALEHDVELRRQGLWRLDIASDDYRHYLMKKKLSEVSETEDKLLTVDALGVVMIRHGEEFGEESAYGRSLVSFGRAHCAVASLQESFAATLDETYISAVRQSEDEIKEYQVQRRKLESRRVSYDAAAAKLEKVRHAKKVSDKDREEAEEELETAKARYEETLEDVRVRMVGIQENEVVQLRELTNFLDLEITYVRSYLDELMKVRADWVDEETLKKLGAPKARPPPRPTPASRAGSIRSTKSGKGKKAPEADADDSSDDGAASTSGKKAHGRTKSEAGSRPPSRAPSRASRKRADSTATATSEKEEKEEKDKDAKPAKSSNRLSLAGWGSMGSIMGRGKKDSKEKEKEKSKDKFAELESDESETDEFGVARHKRRLSVPALSGTSPKLPMRLLKSASKESQHSPSPSQSLKDVPTGATRKRVVALHDFAAGSTDELSFRAGDQIDVVSEVLDGWWLGDLGGKRGLFPTTYTEVLNTSSTSLPQKPPLPQRPPASVTRTLANGSGGGGSAATSSLSSLEEGAMHPFGDHLAPFGNGNGASAGRRAKKRYEESIDSSQLSVSDGEDDDDDSSSLMRVQRVDDSFASVYVTGLPNPVSSPAPASPVAPPIPLRRGTAGESSSPAKKAPPPPPPRRSTLSNASLPAPAPPTVPSRPGTLRAKSTSGVLAGGARLTLAEVSVGADPDGLTHSPFDSPREAETRFGSAAGMMMASAGAGAGGCGEFKQNPFKPQGYCNNCFKMHY